MNALLIAGTDTRVGKTVLTMALAAYWQTYCLPRSLGVMKPIDVGVGDADRDRYAQHLDLHQSPDEITPLRFEASLVPPIAAAREGQKIKLEKVWRVFDALCQSRDFVLIEGVGGLGTPVTAETTLADLAWDWRIPIVLVVPVQPGAIAQAVAQVALAQQSKAYLKGIVLNCVQPCTEDNILEWASPSLIQSLTQKPVLGCMPYIADLTDLSKLAQLVSSLDVERLLPLPVPG
ncbi:ATP-dependent dethiobiotin synthetase BioD [Oscillatoria sp. FACHB-1407]|uniref:dethiobiotin synthase n=1 Tax=Oscillatoria sp. FACHB-1407 TaxID=2692847 RepID=UPI00168386BB|nr:dethiobiotin synthase [Oscillatoria sp. FACHB-1407]MBD2464123.1 ATP-dependent dethiobiotin synthetase BioD [Oscillatoria sp. FACHB-1407]